MSFLIRLMPYWRWIAGALGIAAVVGTGAYIRHLSVEAEIAQRSYEQVVEQLQAVTRELEVERERTKRIQKQVDEAAKEAAEHHDASDSASESTKRLLGRLYDN